MLKKCFKCGDSKPRSEFYKHKMMADGLLGKCKTCHKIDVAINYGRKRDLYLAYDRGRNKRPARRASNRRRWNEWMSDPLHRKAATAINNAIKRGKIKRPDRCSRCQEVGKVDGHHPDYTKPLDVVWLCRMCHRAEHAKTQQPPF